MRSDFFRFRTVFWVSLCMLGFTYDHSGKQAYDPVGFYLPSSVDCAPGIPGDFSKNENGKFISILPGWGDHTYNITTQSDSAQRYFNQGLSMYYSYHATEAIASFKEAARFDSSCAMAYWGQALAMGPSYNGYYQFKLHKNIGAILDNMNRWANRASATEKELITAMDKRYNRNDTANKQRTALNEAYMQAMHKIIGKYSGDADIKALYIDAVMLIHPWNFWNNDGSAKMWTPELVNYCQEILKKDPHHPAGLHYYIHITEASRKPEVALPNADSLLRLFPGVAHMVHMSSHEYERIGYYAAGVAANEKADSSLAQYDSLAKGLLPVIHSQHYFAVDAYCAMSGAMHAKAVNKALACRALIKPDNNATYQQYLFMFPDLARVRLGLWGDILADTLLVQPTWTYAGILQDFSKGMAYAKLLKFDNARQCLSALRTKQKDSILRVKFSPHMSSALECSKVAENILEGVSLFQQGQKQAALIALRKAIAFEDSLIYSEPKAWMLPARQYAGAFLLQMGKISEAEKIYRQDLIWNPGNGWSLLGLYQSLKGRDTKGERANLKRSYLHSFSGCDIVPTTSAY